jgi:hypothetical protein
MRVSRPPIDFRYIHQSDPPKLCRVWEAQRVVWREDLAVIEVEGERTRQVEDREREQQAQGNQEQSFGYIARHRPILGDFLYVACLGLITAEPSASYLLRFAFRLSDLLSLGAPRDTPVMDSGAQLRDYIRPGPVSSFLDEVSRLRREIRTGARS